MEVRAEAMRELHRAKTQFDMDAFLSWVAQQFEKEYMTWVEIHPSDNPSNDWYKSPGFRDIRCNRVAVAPAYIDKVLGELLIQGYNIYSQAGNSFAVTLYQYPSSHFGGAIIYQSNDTFKY